MGWTALDFGLHPVTPVNCWHADASLRPSTLSCSVQQKEVSTIIRCGEDTIGVTAVVPLDTSTASLKQLQRFLQKHAKAHAPIVKEVRIWTDRLLAIFAYPEHASGITVNRSTVHAAA